MTLPAELVAPPREFTLMPFWFWNDALDAGELVRQLDDFQRHGVHGFVIHPRVGLPRDLGWMSDPLLDFYELALREARQRGMQVMLYDEGMYPSGSSSGQVVAANPSFACRCLARVDLPDGGRPVLKDDEQLVAVVRRHDGHAMAVVDRRCDSFIRGLHFIGEGPAEDEPPAADLLNPAAMATFVRLVYDKFAARFSGFFGNTVVAIFTDEPGLLGKCRERDVMPGTTGILEHVNRILGYDFTPHLPALWHDDEPDAARHRADYLRAVNVRLEETYYRQLSDWCQRHGVALAGHPHKGDDLGVLRHFQIPGQDTVWRWVLPDQPSALEGCESTQAKCSAAAMLHGGRRRNGNECCGAYGHELTWDEMCWLALWCFVRGVNLLLPHAFYYSVRGVRWDERPPDVGPHSAWWDRYGEYAIACRRLSWLNTDCTHVCGIAILGRSDWLPWRAAKVCFQRQRDFNYLEERDILDRATVDAAGIQIAGRTYGVLIVEHEPEQETARALAPLAAAGRVIRFGKGASDAELIAQLDARVVPDVRVTPDAPGLRVRHVVKDGAHCYLLFNETHAPLTVRLCFAGPPPRTRFDPFTGAMWEWPPASPLELAGHAACVLVG